MKPVITPGEMKAIDAAAPVPEATLIERAGWAVARQARLMLGGTYGRRVTVIAGGGNNGADGRVAARFLADAGIRTTVIEPGRSHSILDADLVIDAAFGTGFHGNYEAPDTGGAPVLAVDIPSGVDGMTGTAVEGAVRATQTLTFAAMKPGLVLGAGRELAGTITVADIGLDVDGARIHALENDDVFALLPELGRNAHKWQAAVVVVAGSPGMMGAATFVSRGAQRAGAGMVRLGSPGVSGADLPISEAVALPLDDDDWVPSVLRATNRAKAIVIGPGLGRSEDAMDAVREVLRQSDVPVLIDGDGLFALSHGEGESVLTERQAPTVLTPHDGEFERLSGKAPGEDRIADVRALADRLQCTVLLKGSTTVVAGATGEVLLATAGSSRLATAGTGDVLSGVIGAFLARGLQPLTAAALGAHVHGRAAQLGFSRGLVAGDLPDLVARYLSDPLQ